ncbi:transmembrane protein, putative [Medicago truncatula]|uniref:Transmembrane protein, putative n=1 Tax=Medicago truncatula TaxID=3880 RepID=A0A072TV53_MEDTR|nr:transmembrane protein, putative [Medicago truncatula]KEH17410.1 transmembrane protein, putative [Medicago truncatula]
MVAYMFSVGWEVGGAGWRWRRGLWVWEEEMLGECIILLGYTVSSAYHLLTSSDTPQVEGADALVWHKHVPLKVQTPLLFQIISFSSLIKQKEFEQGAPFCSLFGCLVYGSFGMTGISWWIELSGMWLKANNVVFVFGFHLWWSSPLDCLGLA